MAGLVIVCYNNRQSFQCTMYHEVSTDIDECSSRIHTCVNDTACTDTDGSFLCSCDSGFSGDATVACTG